jgi:predicted amidophosphoribosyltransferase
MPYCKNCGNKIPEDAAYCPTCGKPLQTPTQLTLARSGERFIALPVDLVILSIILAPVNFSMTWSGY